jgi:hypothetical protein
LLRQPRGFEGFVLALIEADRDRPALAERPKLRAAHRDLGPAALAPCPNAAHSHHLIGSIDDLVLEVLESGTRLRAPCEGPPDLVAPTVMPLSGARDADQSATKSAGRCATAPSRSPRLSASNTARIVATLSSDIAHAVSRAAVEASGPSGRVQWCGTRRRAFAQSRLDRGAALIRLRIPSCTRKGSRRQQSPNNRMSSDLLPAALRFEGAAS